MSAYRLPVAASRPQATVRRPWATVDAEDIAHAFFLVALLGVALAVDYEPASRLGATLSWHRGLFLELLGRAWFALVRAL